MDYNSFNYSLRQILEKTKNSKTPLAITPSFLALFSKTHISFAEDQKANHARPLFLERVIVHNKTSKPLRPISFNFSSGNLVLPCVAKEIHVQCYLLEL